MKKVQTITIYIAIFTLLFGFLTTTILADINTRNLNVEIKNLENKIEALNEKAKENTTNKARVTLLDYTLDHYDDKYIGEFVFDDLSEVYLINPSIPNARHGIEGNTWVFRSQCNEEVEYYFLTIYFKDGTVEIINLK